MRSATPDSVARTERPFCLIFLANSICSCSSPKGSSARAWPWEMSPCWTICLTSAGSSKQADEVGDGRAVDLDAAGQLFLGALILINVALERLGLFDRVEVFALDVFDDRQLGHLPVVDFADQDGHLAPVGCLGGAQAALAGDQFVVVANEADDQRLQNAVGANAVGQIGDLGFFECLARLVRVADDRVAVQPGLAVLVARDSDVAGHVDRGGWRRLRIAIIPGTTQQGFQTTSQTSFFRHGQSSLNFLLGSLLLDCRLSRVSEMLAGGGHPCPMRCQQWRLFAARVSSNCRVHVDSILRR